MPGPINYNALIGGLLGNLLLQPVGDVLPFTKKNPGFLNLSEGARPYAGGGTPGRGPANQNQKGFLPPDARLSDIPGFGGRPLKGYEITADKALNQTMRSAATKLRAAIKDPAALERATDQLFSASVRPNAQYEIATLLRNLLGPQR